MKGKTDSSTDNVVKESLKKEQQPNKAGDLSPIQNTHEVGTAGGDQRAKDVDPGKNDKKGKSEIKTMSNEKPVAPKVEEPKNKSVIKQEDPSSKKSVKTK